MAKIRRRLSNSELKDLNSTLSGLYGLQDFFQKKEGNVEIKDDSYIFIAGEMVFFLFEGRPIPSLKLLLKGNFLKKAVVDMGAIRFVANGADIMRPGIRSVDPAVKAGDPISVVDETHQKPLCVGIALFSGQEIASQSSGKAIRNIHHVGDKIWAMEP